MSYSFSRLVSFFDEGSSPTLRKRTDTKKLGGDLVELSTQYSLYSLVFGEDAAAKFPSDDPQLQLQNGMVMVDIATQDIDLLLTELDGHGFVPIAEYGAMVSGYLPIDTLMAISDSEVIQFIRPTYQPIVRQGSTGNQGTIALKADVAQAEFNVTGAGVTIGVLSDSFDNLDGASADRLSGDLPEVNVLQDLPGGGSDEGRAMLQLIADIAPGADLAFQTAFLGQASFAQGILDLAAAGADIIVDDVIYLAEPFFQDGVIAQAIDQVVADGVAYFSAAGNNGDTAYESAFRNSGISLDFGNFQVEAHDFDPGEGVDIFQTITVGAGAEINLSFQWASPYFSASGVQGATSDLDIFLLNSNNQVVAASFDDNINGDPIEILNFRNPELVDTEYSLVLGKFGGDDPSLLKYVGFGDLSIDDYDTNSGTLYGHANAKGAQAVGAAFFQESPAFGDPTPTVETFSAVGGTPILFDTAGNPLAQPENRLKPDIVAPDGGNTTFFGQDIAADADTFPNFFGTSAAAPNAAAVAALLLEAVPDATPTEIYQALKTSALDLDDPRTLGFDVGFDEATGFGLIQADAALQTLLNSQPLPTPILVGTDQADTMAGTDSQDIMQSLAGNDQVSSAAGNDKIDGGAGNDTINGGLGDDTLLGGAGDDVLRGDDNNALDGGNDRIFGGTGNDRIGGKAGNDALFGDEGNDSIWGGLGNDTLTGGLGNDILTGGNGSSNSLNQADTFILSAGSGIDTITDFELGIDQIGLADIAINDLNFVANTIRLGSETLAILNGITNAAAVDFVVV